MERFLQRHESVVELDGLFWLGYRQKENHAKLYNRGENLGHSDLMDFGEPCQVLSSGLNFPSLPTETHGGLHMSSDPPLIR